MTIVWSSENRATFRLALQEAYTDYDLLEIFVDETLDKSLAEIAEQAALPKVTHKLLKWAQAENRLEELFQKFCEAHPRLKNALVAKLQQKPLIGRSTHLLADDWEGLFAMFDPDDSADLQIAFRQAFEAVYGRRFWDLRPDRPPMNNPDDIQALLVQYDDPILAVRFVEASLKQFQRSNEKQKQPQDLTALQDWRDRIAQQHNVPPLAPAPPQTIGRQGYLLVAVQKCDPDVIVFPELRITGEASPIPFGVSPVTCAFGDVPNYLSDWIYQAEKALDHEEILLELFLPWERLEEDLATTWELKDKRGDPISLGMHRLFVVRSFDRLQDEATQKALERKWQLLKECVSAGTACDRFHLQEKYLETKGALKALLEKAPGLKLAAKLPLEPEKRKALLYEIIDAAVPIALWSPSISEAMLAELKTQMHNLSRESNLTNFADLAYRWREKLAQSETESETEAVKHIRLLCDCPDRLPNLPDPDREDDLLVA